MSLRKHIQRFVGQHVECHTYYGTFQGVVVHCTKHHVVLAPIHPDIGRRLPPPTILTGLDAQALRSMQMGPGGPPGPGPGWHMAIPLAAILGITALGLHWW